MKYLQRNKSVIDRAFKHLADSQEQSVREGMVKIAEAGMAFLVEAHENHADNMMHTEEEDTMAYAIAHDGMVIKSGYYRGGGDDFPGDAMNKAKALLSRTSGWVAIVLSEMEGWYRVDWEMNFLHYSAEHIRSNFSKFFKPVSR